MAAKASGFTKKEYEYDKRLLAIIGVLSAVWLGYVGWLWSPIQLGSAAVAAESPERLLVTME